MKRIINNIDIMKEWSFHKGDVENGEDPNFEDEEWRLVDLPHDWSIEGPFRQFRDENWHAFRNLDLSIGYLPQDNRFKFFGCARNPDRSLHFIFLI